MDNINLETIARETAQKLDLQLHGNLEYRWNGLCYEHILSALQRVAAPAVTETGNTLYGLWCGNSYEWDAEPDVVKQRWNRLAAKYNAALAAQQAAEKRMEEIKAAADADEADMEKMRDGAKLTRYGVVEALAYQRQETQAAEKRVKELESSLKSQTNNYLSLVRAVLGINEGDTIVPVDPFEAAKLLWDEKEIAEKRVKDLELTLSIIGDMAVSDWNDEVVGKVDAVVKEPLRYKDRIKALFDQELDRVKQERDEEKKASDLIGSACDKLRHNHSIEKRELLADNARLRSALEEAKRDTARMEWLERSIKRGTCDTERQYIALKEGPMHDQIILQTYDGRTTQTWEGGESIRAAIDAAMQPNPSKP